MEVSSKHIRRAIDTLAELVASGEDRARDPLLVLGKLAEEVEGLREGRYAPVDNPRPLRDFLGILPAHPQAGGATMYAILDGKLAEISERANAVGLIYDDDVETLIGALRDAEDQLQRLQKATLGRCASCGRDGMVVYFDREAMVCVDFDNCWKACRAADEEARP